VGPDFATRLCRQNVNRVAKKVAAGQTCFGTFVYSPDAAITELIGSVGFDFVIIDTEHAALDAGDVENLTRAAAAGGATPFVRVGDPSPSSIGRMLDLGASGVVIPHLANADAASKALQAALYPPRGSRGACTTSRATSYGVRAFQDYVEESLSDVWVIGQIEDIAAVESIDSIVSAGIHALMPGPSDLAATLGVPGQFDHPLVVGAVDRILAAGRGKVPTMMYVNKPGDASTWIAKGVSMISYSIDYKVTARAYQSAMEELRRAK
jgi:2-keto-3-deoxy-L-rhamnonate aldolase RhmA